MKKKILSVCCLIGMLICVTVAANFSKEEQVAATFAMQSEEDIDKQLQDEIRNDEPTGRKKVTIITTDFFRNAVIVKNIIVPAKLAEGFCSMFSEGDTAILYLSYILHKGESKPQKPGGIGRQRVTEGKDYLELVLVGAPPLESIEEPLEKSVVKVLLKERAQKLEEIKELGYQGQGSKAAESTPKTKKNTSKKSLTKAEIEDIDEDDIPF